MNLKMLKIVQQQYKQRFCTHNAAVAVLKAKPNAEMAKTSPWIWSGGYAASEFRELPATNHTI